MGAAGVVLVAVGLACGAVLLARLPVPGPAGPASPTTVSVVIPARDEAANLPALLQSLAGQTEPATQILVVDDGSTDGTAAVARRHGATVIAASSPPDRWLGKPWACATGVQAADGALLVLLDADTRLAPDGLARLRATHGRLTAHGLLSVQPYHEVRRPHEQLSAVCNVVPVLASGAGAPWPSRSSRVAFGPCLVTRATDLAAAGGFAAVAGEVVEDAALARAYRQAGRTVRCLGGGPVVRFRMYPDGLGPLVEGWTKNLAGGAARAVGVPLLGAVAWVAAGLSIIAALVTSPGPLAAGAAALFALELWWMLRRLGSFHPLTSLVWPIPLLAFTLLFLWSIGLRAARRPVRWRGRAIDPRRGSIL